MVLARPPSGRVGLDPARMRFPKLITRLRARDVVPILAARTSLVVMGKALARMWGRDVMLYNGGVSFFVMLAIFPAIAIVMGLYSVLSDPAVVAQQGEALAQVMPDAAR